MFTFSLPHPLSASVLLVNCVGFLKWPCGPWNTKPHLLPAPVPPAAPGPGREPPVPGLCDANLLFGAGLLVGICPVSLPAGCSTCWDSCDQQNMCAVSSGTYVPVGRDQDQICGTYVSCV